LRPGASNPAQANLEGGRTVPMSTASTRIPMAEYQLHLLRHLQQFRTFHAADADEFRDGACNQLQ
jgi:hypothetical protein